MPTPKLAICALLGAAAVALPASGVARVNGQTANSIATAYPMTPGVTYGGDFQSQTETEYLSFNVAKAGQGLHFVVRNTTKPCVNPSSETPCPVFGTLVDGGGHQVGGEGSSAGTSRVDAGHSDVIDWTFSKAGTYYVAVDSSGDFPTFTVRYTVAFTLKSLFVRSPQHGTTARGVVRFAGRARRLEARVLRGSTRLGRTVMRNVGSGRHRLAVKLNRAGRLLLAKRHRLRLTFKVVASPVTGGSAALARRFTLTS